MIRCLPGGPLGSIERLDDVGHLEQQPFARGDSSANQLPKQWSSEKKECSCYGTVLNFTQLHTLYAGLKHFTHFTRSYFSLRSFTQFYAELIFIRSFTQYTLLYAAERVLRS